VLSHFPQSPLYQASKRFIWIHSTLLVEVGVNVRSAVAAEVNICSFEIRATTQFGAIVGLPQTQRCSSSSRLSFDPDGGQRRTQLFIVVTEVVLWMKIMELQIVVERVKAQTAIQ